MVTLRSYGGLILYRAVRGIRHALRLIEGPRPAAQCLFQDVVEQHALHRLKQVLLCSVTVAVGRSFTSLLPRREPVLSNVQLSRYLYAYLNNGFYFISGSCPFPRNCGVAEACGE